MSETPKRRRGDRRDAALLRETDALHFIMGIIYPHRADNEAYIAERIDLEPIKAYLAKKNVEGIEFKYTFFHVIVAALVKTITLRPKLNRFYANENYYQRNKVTAGFIIKKEFSDGSEEAVALLDAAPTDTVDTVHEEIRRRVSFIAPVIVYPGEDEMQSLAFGCLRVLRGEETARTYTKVE